MTRIKICGIKTLTEALVAVEAGADALGFVFAPSSRQVTPAQAREIIRNLPPFVTTVGVFVNEDPRVVDHLADFCSLDLLQFHGSEPPGYCRKFRKRQVLKAFRVKDAASLGELAQYKGFALLLDTYVSGAMGGTGQTFDWTLVEQAKEYGPVIMAGGLTPENVALAIAQGRPYGVDVSSGVETGGKKDPDKIRRFIREVRRNQDATR